MQRMSIFTIKRPRMRSIQRRAINNQLRRLAASGKVLLIGQTTPTERRHDPDDGC